MISTNAIWILLGFVVIYLLLSRVRAARSRVAPEEARRLVGGGATLVDVRTTQEYQGGHLDGALNIPLHTLTGSLDSISRDGPVVLYCRSGARSARAAKLLRAAGFAEVHDLGPMRAYPG